MQNKQPGGSGVFSSAPSDDSTKKKHDQLIEQIRQDGNLPAIGSSVSKVIQLTSSGDEAVRHLAQFILADVALTQKVLRVANAACFRTSSGTQVTTVSKAIFLLGFETVKTSALAMLLVDGMAGKRGKSVRIELVQALTASVVGRELARRSQFRDAEEAAVASLFKNIGRLLVASYDHAAYDEIMSLIDNGTSPPAAAMRVLGCTFEELAAEVLHEWQIPEAIVEALQPLPAGQIKTAKTRQEWVHQVATFSHSAASLIALNDDNGESVAARLLLERFGTVLGLDQSKLTQLFTVVKQETAILSRNMNLPQPSQQNATRAAAEEGSSARKKYPWEQEDEGLPAELLMASPSPAPVLDDQRHPSGKPVNARDLLLAGVQDVTEIMASGRCKANDLIMLVLETLYRSLGFRFATICLKDIKANEFRARIALGENNAMRQAGFVFPGASSRNLFHLAMENDADLLISDAQDAKIRDLIPAWHRALLPDARSFIVLPLVVQGKPFGLFYADRILPAPEGVPPDETSLIKTLKGQVLAALNTR